MNTKVQISNAQLLERMKKLEEVTGRQVAMTLKRGARLLAINVARSTPPYGLGADAKKAGEQAVQNDVLRVMKPLYPTIFAYLTKATSFVEEISKLKSKNLIKSMTQAGSANDLQAIFNNAGQFGKLTVNADANSAHDVYHGSRNAYGRVGKGWKGRNIIYDPGSLNTFIRAKQALVGMSKAAWAALAVKVGSDVKNPLAGIPAWVKRHIATVPCTVDDNSDQSLPTIKLTSQIPWADKALRRADYDEAIRISRQKFFNSMGTEIRKALQAQEAA
jgi:hypothetical protein